MREKVIAIVPAAGAGKRFGANKAFYLLFDVPLIIWSLRVLEEVDLIEEIIPVLKERDMQKGAELFERFNLLKIKKIAPGGKERQDSIYNALRLIREEKSLILIHDGARPLIDGDLIRKTIKSLGSFDGVVTGVPVKDTIKEVKASNEAFTVIRTLNRENLWAIQTPQVFRFGVLMKAYEEAMDKDFYSTDDSALVERLGCSVKVIMGSYNNIKVTTPEDIAIIEGLKRINQPKNGFRNDKKRENPLC